MACHADGAARQGLDRLVAGNLGPAWNPTVDTTHPAPALEVNLPLIECTALSRSYGEAELHDGSPPRRPALVEASFSIERGEFVAVVGPSGSGKSTLLNLLGGLDHASSGRIVIDGIDLSNAGEDALDLHRRDRVGFVFQSFHLNPRRTAVENVMLPLVFSPRPGHEARATALRRLREVALEPLADRPVSTLSGGQRQRVAIARALVRDPSLLLADEPVGNLDASTGKEIVDLLRTINRKQGVTIVAVSHDALLLEACARVLELDEGRLRESSGRNHTRIISPPSQGAPKEKS